MGLTAMKARTFYVVSQLGMLAGTLVYVNAGTQLAQHRLAGKGIVSPGLVGSFRAAGRVPAGGQEGRRRDPGAQGLRALGAPRPKRYDRNLVVIGAGAAGLVTSYIAAAVKAKVTLVEGTRWAATA
jgi:hypothetical protein